MLSASRLFHQAPEPDSSLPARIIFWTDEPWHSVYSRHQHLLIRLSAHYPVVYFQQPVSRLAYKSRPPAPIFSPYTNISVVDIPVAFSRLPLAARSRLALNSHDIFYVTSPRFWPLIKSFPRAMLISESHEDGHHLTGPDLDLLSQSHLRVFSHPSLAKTYSHLSASSLIIPSAPRRPTPSASYLPPNLVPLSSPRVGFMGPLDQKLDMDLISAIALRFPHLSFIFLGPLSQLIQTKLPRLPNLHYFNLKQPSLGQAYLQSFDIAWIPYRYNLTTAHLSLQFLLDATSVGLPLISPPFSQATDYFSRSSRFGHNVSDVSTHLQYFLQESPFRSTWRQLVQHHLSSQFSWDTSAHHLEQAIQAHLSRVSSTISSPSSSLRLAV